MGSIQNDSASKTSYLLTFLNRLPSSLSASRFFTIGLDLHPLYSCFSNNQSTHNKLRKMGQAPQSSVAQSSSFLAPSTSYPIDPRMVNYSIPIPAFFSSAAQKFIDEIENIQREIPAHPLQKYLINGIIKHFSLLTQVVEQPSGVSLEEQGKVEEWSGLSSEQEFLNTLTKLKRQYQIELSLMELYNRYFSQMEHGVASSKGAETERLRKKHSQSNTVEVKLDQNLILRLFFHFYLRVMRINANQSQSVLQFHAQTGRQLCLLIYYNELSVSELFSLFYHLVHIDRHGLERSDKLALIDQNYHSLCLQKKYTINIKRPKCQMIQMAARLYLDQLYLRSIREAEDPEVKHEDDALLPTKMFPIYRVKSKVKN